METKERTHFVNYLKDKYKHLKVTQDANEFWKLLDKEGNENGPANKFYDYISNAMADYYYDNEDAGELFVELNLYSGGDAVDFYFQNCL
jgi:hypothetical protein